MKLGPTVATSLLLGILAAGTFAFGSVTPLARAIFLASLSLWLVISPLLLAKPLRPYPLIAPTLFTALFLLLQSLSLPDFLLGQWSLDLYPKNARASVMGESTLETALSSGVYLALAWAAWHAMGHRKSRQLFSRGIVVLALCVAGLALLQKLMGGTRPFLIQFGPQLQKDSFFGPFINANHGATLMGTGTLLSLSLALPRAHKRQWKYHWLGPAFLLFLALLATGSHGGILALTAACALTCALFFAQRLPIISGGIALFSAGSAVMVASAPGQLLLARIAQFLGASPAGMQRRQELWADLLAALSTSPFWGSGWGTFPWISGHFSKSREWLHYSHAHNDYYEALIEGGLPILGAIIWVGTLLVILMVKNSRHRRPLASSALMGASLVPLIHAWVDFPLQIPAISAIFVLLLMAALRSWMEHGPSQKNGLPLHPVHLLAPVALMLLCVWNLQKTAQAKDSTALIRGQIQRPPATALSLPDSVQVGQSDIPLTWIEAAPVRDLADLSYDSYLMASQDIENHGHHLRRALDLATIASFRAPTFDRAQRMVGWSYFYLGEHKQAQEALKRAIFLGPYDPYNYLFLARYYRLNRKLPAAKLAYSDALAVADHSRSMKLFDELWIAWPDLNTLKTLLPPDDALSRQYFSQWSRRKGLWKANRAELLAEYEQDPRNAQCLEDLFRLEVQSHNLPAAEQWLNKLSALNLPGGRSFLLRGDWLYAQGKWLNALAHYRQARNVNPSPGHQVRVLKALTQVEAWKQLIQEGQDFLNKSPTESWQSPYVQAELRRYLATGHLKTGDNNSALVVIQEAHALDSNIASVAIVFAQTLEALGRRAEAISHLQSHLSSNPKHNEASLELGLLAQKAGNLALARSSLNFAAKFPSTQKRARQALRQLPEN